MSDSFDVECMRRAVLLAARGEGHVEPNPLVGCVVASAGRVVGEGWHQQYGGPHAEVEALRAAGERATGATLYVTLEPCCHQGKTPPCTDAVLEAGVGRVVIGSRDPFPEVNGGGIRRLVNAGLQVDVGVAEFETSRLIAPFSKLQTSGRPWVVAKWAMTLDGKIATRSGSSQWISNEASRKRVHQLRGRMDAILVGSGTALADDPQLTARPPGPRVPLRVVADGRGRLPLDSRLVRTADETPVLVAVGKDAESAAVDGLKATGCEVFLCDGATHAERIESLLDELGRRRLTNLLVEGGGQLLGTMFDQGLLDEVHAFVAPRLSGGIRAASPLAGTGVERMADARQLDPVEVEMLDGDVYIHGRFAEPRSKP